MIVGLLEWIGRALFILFVVRVVSSLFSSGNKRQASRPGGPGGPAAPAEPSERTGGTLVRDPQCGTYVSKTRSFQVGHGDTAQYFCSSECRDKYAALHGR